ncbi:MAG: hypothetical protein OEU84_06635 [Xanthomonadales bacterium]|jgi:hypothetical protein|nr:hypothetical protein [Xanthomonadales bacterium]MDH4019260.1 hypothetical protein [Xanthomonadales bacterium]
MSNWTIFSNHGHVLVCLTRNPEARLRDVAADVGITERAVQKIVRDLQDGGMISITKNGRRNCYSIHKKQPLRHPLEAECKIKDLIRVVNKKPGPVQPGTLQGSGTGRAVNLESESRENTVGAESDIKAKPPSETSKSGKSDKPKKDITGSGGSEASDTIERQQGSLF